MYYLVCCSFSIDSPPICFVIHLAGISWRPNGKPTPREADDSPGEHATVHLCRYLETNFPFALGLSFEL